MAKEQIIVDTEWVKPGISSWNWWSDHNGGRKFESLKRFVDFSAFMEWPYSLVDANWQDMDKGSLEQLVTYANSKNIGLFIWYNSGGSHTHVMDAGPRDLMHDKQKRREELKRISDLGIKGIKVDFFQGEKQGIIKLYLEIIKDAAEYHLMVITHGCTIPRGWMRTYPNIISMEAVRGGELYSNPQYPKQAVYQNTILPFSRNVIGSMDFTPVTFSDFNKSCKHVTSNAHELALSVVFESGIQHFSDRVESYMSMPVEVIEYLKKVPTIWDDTKFIEGYPGEYVVMARKRKDNWYIAGINGSMKEKNIQLDLSGLYQEIQNNIILFTDGEFSREIKIDSVDAKTKNEISIKMMPAGGFCMYSN